MTVAVNAPVMDFADADVLNEGSPELAMAWVRALAQQHYGVVGDMKPLTGERDRNYFMESAADGARYMLKISHPAEKPVVADFQIQALRHIAMIDPGLSVQRIVLTLEGQPSFIGTPSDGLPRVVRLFTFLPGMPMPETPRTTAQRENLARMLARLGIALRGFEHPAGALALPWDVQHADSVQGLLMHIVNADRRAMAQRALDCFTLNVKPALPKLRTQAIHNDLNIYNVLVDAQDTDRIAAIIDFGDMVRAPLIDDVAVAAAYQMGCAMTGAGDDPLAEVVSFVAAYHAVSPLLSAELDVLFTLMTARLVMVVAISGWRAARCPDNAAYLLRNNAVSWARLQACERVGQAAATSAFRKACGFH